MKETFPIESSLKQKMSGNKYIYCCTFFECLLSPNFPKNAGENDKDENLKDFSNYIQFYSCRPSKPYYWRNLSTEIPSLIEDKIMQNGVCQLPSDLRTRDSSIRCIGGVEILLVQQNEEFVAAQLHK